MEKCNHQFQPHAELIVSFLQNSGRSWLHSASSSLCKGKQKPYKKGPEGRCYPTLRVIYFFVRISGEKFYSAFM